MVRGQLSATQNNFDYVGLMLMVVKKEVWSHRCLDQTENDCET